MLNERLLVTSQGILDIKTGRLYATEEEAYEALEGGN